MTVRATPHQYGRGGLHFWPSRQTSRSEPVRVDHLDQRPPMLTAPTPFVREPEYPRSEHVSQVYG